MHNHILFWDKGAKVVMTHDDHPVATAKGALGPHNHRVCITHEDSGDVFHVSHPVVPNIARVGTASDGTRS